MISRWLVEQGIGETRAALIEDGRLVAARLWRDTLCPYAGQVMDAALATATPPQARLADGTMLSLTRLPKGVSEGAAMRIQIRRGPIAERSGLHHRIKPGRAVTVAADTPLLGNDPVALLSDSQYPAELCPLSPPPVPDALASAGWDDMITEASAGVVSFAGGELLITPTPAMTVIDVDGTGSPASIACAAAPAIAAALHRFDIGGMIAVDFPTQERREDRQRAADAFDTAMIGPFERTAINGFGLMQVVRKRPGPSLIELCQLRPLETAVLALLRQAERWVPPNAEPNHKAAGGVSDQAKAQVSHQPGDIALILDAAGAALLAGHPGWCAQLRRRTGRNVVIREGASSPDGYRLELVRAVG